jgi:hypothetical protein
VQIPVELLGNAMSDRDPPPGRNRCENGMHESSATVDNSHVLPKSDYKQIKAKLRLALLCGRLLGSETRICRLNLGSRVDLPPMLGSSQFSPKAS